MLLNLWCTHGYPSVHTRHGRESGDVPCRCVCGSLNDQASCSPSLSILPFVWFGRQDVELEELVRREKMGGDDMDAEFARNIVRLGSRFRGTEQRTGYVAS